MESKDDPVAYTDENGTRYVKDFKGKWVEVDAKSQEARQGTQDRRG